MRSPAPARCQPSPLGYDGAVPGPLTRAFVAGGGPAPSDAARHEATLRALCSAAREAWPQVGLDDGAVATWLGARWRDGGVVRHASDVALACACAAQRPGAHEALLAMLTRLARVLKQLGAGRADKEDVCQAVLDKLLLPRNGVLGISRYEGTGPLEGWLRAALVRTALNLERSGRQEDPTEFDELARAATLSAAPELSYVRARYRPEFAAAFRHALAGLSSRDRNLLRLHHLNGVTLDALATMHQVHRATVARWLAAARQAAVEATRQGLRDTLKVDEQELTSLIRALESQLHVSLERALRTGP